jgi:hypothetical protein
MDPKAMLSAMVKSFFGNETELRGIEELILRPDDASPPA